MYSTKNITIKTVKQNIVFKNINSFLNCKKPQKLDIYEKTVKEYLSLVANVSKTAYQKHGGDLEDIIAQCFFLLFEYLDYQNKQNYKEYKKPNLYQYIRRHITKYCKSK